MNDYNESSRRFESLSEIAELQKPSWLIELISTEVLFHISPNELPLEYVDLRKLAAELEQKFGLRFAGPRSIEHALRGHYSSSSSSSSDERMPLDALMDDDSLTIRFKNGQMRLQSGNNVRIREVRIDRESIFVKVADRTEFAEAVLAETAEIVWRASGAFKNWSSISKHVQLKTYGVGTKIDLGVPLEMLISPQLSAFVHGRILGPDGYVRDMGSVDAQAGFSPPREVAAAFSVDELHLVFNRFDQRTGRSETSRLRLGVVSKSEQGSGVVFLASTMPFERHMEMIGELRQAIRDNNH